MIGIVRTLRPKSVPRCSALGPTLVVCPVRRLYKLTVLRELPYTMSGSFGSGAAMPYSWMFTGCQSWKVISPSIERLSTHAEPESCWPPHSSVREGIVGRDVIHRARWLRVPIAPRQSAIGRDDAALVGHDEEDVRIVRVDPRFLIVVAARRAAHGAPGDAAVLRSPHHRRATVDDVLVLADPRQASASRRRRCGRVGEDPADRRRVLRRPPLGDRVDDQIPVLAGVGRLVEADDARRRRRRRRRRVHRRAPPRRRRVGVPATVAYSTFGLLGARAMFAWITLGRPSVSCFHVVPPSVDLKMPLPAPPNPPPSMYDLLLLPQRRVDGVGIARVDADVIAARVLVLV